ncbi:MAG: HAMP domain-containing sensor histidine kinase [Neisseria sp.]|nr:HAMP domain-containing sensor histidine kinase [Neisseria sp.]
MAGAAASINRSLRRQLSVGLSLLVSAVALAAGALSYYSAFREAHTLQDSQLKHIAGLVDPRSPLLRQGGLAPNDGDTDLPQPDVVIQSIASPELDRIFNNPGAAAALRRYPPGFHDFYSRSGEEWRVYIHEFRRPGQRVVLAQRAAHRNRIAATSARLAVVPLLVLIPLVWLFTGLLTRRLLRPLQQLSNEVGHRTENDLQPLDSRHVPQEVLPLVEAINRQLEQIRAAREHDKRFIGNAAHELRTPVTALTLQMAQLAQQDLSEAERRDKLAKVRSGLQRTQQLLNQLLSMARAQNTPRQAAADTALLPLLRSLYADALPLIEQKKLDVGVSVAQDYRLAIEQADLHGILKNLLENAIRYTPQGGRIDIGCEETSDGRLNISVRDSGCGIPAAERERVFEPFYRVAHAETGSGLGLSIVKTLCDKWGLHISLADAEAGGASGQSGLAAVVTWPPQSWRRED